MSTIRRDCKVSLHPALALLALAATAACAPVEPEGDAPTFETAEAPLLGQLTYAAECQDDEKAMLDKAAFYGRVAVTTPAFEQCVVEAVRNGLPRATFSADFGVGRLGPYIGCLGDPFSEDEAAEQAQQVVDAARSLNDVSMACPHVDLDALARAPIGHYDLADPESMNWGLWLGDVTDTLGLATCGSLGLDRDNHPGIACRYLPAPWPYSQAAGIIWHEAMHNHGYVHGHDDDNDLAKEACGFGGFLPDWHFQKDTLPYIIGACVTRTIERSAAVCGNIEACQENELHLVSGLNDMTCECRHDPRAEGLAVVSAAGPKMTTGEVVASGERMGGWAFNRQHDMVLAKGDFDADGREEFFIQSSWGVGLIGRDAIGRLVSETTLAFGGQAGGWRLGADDRESGTGDFDADGRTDILVKSAWGLGILTHRGGALTSLLAVPFGTAVGSWTLRSTDRILGVANIEAANRATLVLRAADGTLGLLRLNGAALSLLHRVTPGTRMGAWNSGAADELEALADMNGDLRADLVLRSPWGVGVVTRTAGGALTSLNLWQNGTAVGSWTLAATDELLEAIDVSGDNRAELILRNTTHLGLVTRSAAGGLLFRSRMALGTQLAGGWNPNGGDWIVADGKLDSTAGRELVVQSDWGLGVLTFDSGTQALRTRDLRENDHLIGAWLLRIQNVVQYALDLDGNGVAEVLVMDTPERAL